MKELNEIQMINEWRVRMNKEKRKRKKQEKGREWTRIKEKGERENGRDQEREGEKGGARFNEGKNKMKHICV